MVYETFNGEIPQNYEIDHIDGDKLNNTLTNLRCVPHSVNVSNPVTKIRMKTPKSDFGRKFKEHFGITRIDDIKLYVREYKWFRTHNKVCRWEVEDKCK